MKSLLQKFLYGPTRKEREAAKREPTMSKPKNETNEPQDIVTQLTKPATSWGQAIKMALLAAAAGAAYDMNKHDKDRY